MPPHLRVFPSSGEVTESQQASVRVSLGDLLPLLALAQRRNYLWLHDFLEDEVQITPDLHEILRAFRCRPSA